MQQHWRELCRNCPLAENLAWQAARYGANKRKAPWQRAPWVNQPVGESKEEVRFEGLCITCNLRYSCSGAQVEGGVWRCAEYT